MTKEQFKNKIIIKRTARGFYLQAQTDKCKYGQGYELDNVAELKDRFADFYYKFENEEN